MAFNNCTIFSLWVLCSLAEKSQDRLVVCTECVCVCRVPDIATSASLADGRLGMLLPSCSKNKVLRRLYMWCSSGRI